MSQLEGAAEELGGKKFVFYKLPPKVARRHIIRLTKILGPATASAVDQAVTSQKGKKKAKFDLLDMDVKFGEAVQSIFELADDAYIEQLMDDLASVTHVEPGGVLASVYDVTFSGDPGLQFRWFFSAMGANFGNFIEGLGLGSADLGQRLKSMLAQQSPST